MGYSIFINDILVPIGTHQDKTIVIGADHKGYYYKLFLVNHLTERGHQVIDVGTNSGERCDYPAISAKIGLRVAEDIMYSRIGIGICGTGIGILIPASKYPGVHAARCLTPEDAADSRRYNNSNLLGLGADCMTLDMAVATVDTWLATPFFSNPVGDKEYLDRYIQTVMLEERRER
jgi:ribose 5-phosphate isomerase B